MLSLTVLGSGTSAGVPSIGCECATCTSGDPHDNRLRPSVLFSVNGTNLVIDTASDFRQQMLTHQVKSLDAVLFTHHHFDHIGGFDDIRPYNFMKKQPVPVYGMKRTLDELRTTFRYAFEPPEQEGGGVPQVEVHELPNEVSTLNVCGVELMTIPVFHGNLPVLGFRIGPIAYITDTNNIPESSFRNLQGLEYLILDALRFDEHPTHFSLDQAIAMAKRINAGKTYFTHIAHDIMHERDSALLPESMAFAYDGLVVQSEGVHA
jgi:phosphoribosyl 1,2-cyclic phosphate phosphodiesterase